MGNTFPAYWHRQKEVPPMPWRDSSPMDLKTQFVADYLRQMLSISELSRQYNISRKTAYKWIERYLKEGSAGVTHVPGLFCYLCTWTIPSLAADGAIACFSSSLLPVGLNADRAPQLKASVRRYPFSKDLRMWNFIGIYMSEDVC